MTWLVHSNGGFCSGEFEAGKRGREGRGEFKEMKEAIARGEGEYEQEKIIQRLKAVERVSPETTCNIRRKSR